MNKATYSALLLTLLSVCLIFPVSASADPALLSRQKSKSHYLLQRAKQGLDESEPTFAEVSVHDPSVIRVGDEFYIFGSHLAAAKSADLRHWELVADGVNTANPLFENVVEELQETFEWSDAVDLWANEVIQLEDGRFYMYHNLSRLDSPRASMGLAVADDIEGPYVNHGIFLQSGMWGEISEDGVNVYDPTFHPNTVDPDAFYDRDGTLWLVYGSYSGGIFILELDPVTGMPVTGQGYGKHLMGGNHSRIEGPYILYSPETGYYYLFVTFGGLDYVGGYNMRVARSRNPDGPYLDALGNDMSDVKSDPDLPLFDDESIEPFAQKLMGNHRFLREAGEPGSGNVIGYVSPGHNSAYFDPGTGRYFLIFHTRFTGYGEFHQVRVHEMFLNEDGWFVVAPHRWVPYRYVPWRSLPYHYTAYPLFEAQCTHKAWCWNAETIAAHETAGDYKLINHGKEITAAIVDSVRITLQADGRITGAETGSWSRPAQNTIDVELDGIGMFKGVLSRGWNGEVGQWVVTFSAQSQEGISIWGSKVAD